MADIPEIEEAPDRKPLKCSLERELETGRFSGKRAFTMVTKSDGPITRYGCTSTVSLKDVIDRAGKSLAFDLEGRLDRKRAMIFSIWPLIGRGVEGELLLFNELVSRQDAGGLIPRTIAYPQQVSAPSWQLP